MTNLRWDFGDTVALVSGGASGIGLAAVAAWLAAGARVTILDLSPERLELAPHRVTVNAIAPGPVDTNLTAPLFAMPGAREEFLRHVPLGRIGRPEDIAAMIVFLASDAAE